MGSYEEHYQARFKTMFLTLKILAMFFFSVPMIQYLAIRTSVGSTGQYSFSTSFVMVFLLLICAGLLWLWDDKGRARSRCFSFIEVAIFFFLCCCSVFFSGGVTSYYKFIFIFLIVLYTIEMGMSVGLLLAGLSSAVLVAIDLLMAEDAHVNLFFEKDLVLSGIFFIVAWALGFYVSVSKSTFLQLKQDANLDGLTQIYNHRYFYDKIREDCLLSQEKGGNLALIMLDIDYFKTYNDMYGHQQGDASLKLLVDLLSAQMPKEATLCRYGGEEFSVILKGVPFDDVVALAEQLRQTVADSHFHGQEYMPHGNFTISLGITEFRNGEDSYQNLIHRADTALYRAKFMRRNSVKIYSSIFEDMEKDTNIQDKIHSLKTLITVINSRDSYTYQHVERVVYLCRKFAEYLGLNSDGTRTLIYAAYLHDLGKINISKELLITDHKLTDVEWDELKSHPVESKKIIEEVEGFEDVLPIVLHHHEHYDGTGYPNQLKGEEICYLARVLTLVDSFDAMTSVRPYQKTKTHDQAMQEILSCAGTHFDPELVHQFIAAMGEISPC